MLCSLEELEAFLIENAEEYFRHVALKYTVQQRNYINHLTEHLHNIAKQHHYAMDEIAMGDYVMMRDLIRVFLQQIQCLPADIQEVKHQ